jgi:dephospho-CoA kinase
MLVIGLTGGIGSGKSTVSHILARLGARMVDADIIGHQIYEPGGPAYDDVISTFGREVVGPDGRIDRKQLASIVFAKADFLEKLNDIMHPKIRDTIAVILQEWRSEGTEIAVVEAAILFEAKWTTLVDEVWATLSDESVVLDRLFKAKGMTPEQSRARLRSQMPPEEKAQRSDVVIRNNGSPEELEKQVEDLWRSVNSRLKGSGTSSPNAPS